MEANKGINLEKSIREKEVHDGKNTDSGRSIAIFYALFFLELLT
jgi:hypothetical protein